MSVETPRQLRGLKRAGRLVALTLRALRTAIAPGVSTGELDRLAAEVFAARGARSGPILTYGYPASICIRVDDEVVHGLTSGMVFTIEPMLTSGSTALGLDRDGWTVRALDGSPSAHEEHTIMVAAGGPVVLIADTGPGTRR